MDPLSVAASVVGLLAAGAKITSFLSNMSIYTSDAVRLVRNLLMEVNGISAAATSLQTYITGRTQVSAERASLILLEHVITTLTGCVTTYSELSDIINDLNVDGDISVLDRLKWTRHESKLTAIAQQLQNHKSSLTLMLSILQCQLMEAAEASNRQLSVLVEEVLRTNQDLNLRMRRFESLYPAGSAMLPSIQSRSRSRYPQDRTLTSMADIEIAAFEQDLQRSRVYRRCINNRRSMTSLDSIDMHTTALSMFSKASLSQVSNLSFYILPIYEAELSNSTCYDFADRHRSQNAKPRVHQVVRSPLITSRLASQRVSDVSSIVLSHNTLRVSSSGQNVIINHDKVTYDPNSPQAPYGGGYPRS
ncbi:hypothetical protein EDB81DRAFT_353461 [Dactylonectria macrodidyma]|uniref:Fungal N-terminal domain-containing protein n=1 Tax=Dactylonectria macrodidyma TaxID=307937 RepID=A0A9P9FFH2_9HYPO|nr:hypothetical protein EDB81DRAFT_353461 [Dactylonectria macrodidyma]